jgi:DNA-binding MarR family transcriptional regulator
MMAYLTDVKPKLNQKQHEVYRAIEQHGPITNKQLAEVMDRPVNTITPRCGELRAKGHVVECFKGDDGGRTAIYWGTPAHKKGYEWDEVNG